jgi:hypothetical protein
VGCADARACTVVLRAATTAAAAEAERALHDAHCVVAEAARARMVVPGGGAVQLAAACAVRRAALACASTCRPLAPRLPPVQAAGASAGRWMRTRTRSRSFRAPCCTTVPSRRLPRAAVRLTRGAAQRGWTPRCWWPRRCASMPLLRRPSSRALPIPVGGGDSTKSWRV